MVKSAKNNKLTFTICERLRVFYTKACIFLQSRAAKGLGFPHFARLSLWKTLQKSSIFVQSLQQNEIFCRIGGRVARLLPLIMLNLFVVRGVFFTNVAFCQIFACCEKGATDR